MIKKIFKIGIFIGIASLISKGLGLYREHLLSKIFGGISSDGINLLDAYYIAFRLPDFLYNIILLGAGIAVLVPLYIKLRKNDKELEETFWTINTLLSGFILLLALFLYSIIPYAIPAIFFTYEGEIINTAITLSRIMVLSPIFFSISSLIGAYLQSKEIYTYSHLSPIFYNLGIISGIVYLYPQFGIKGLGYGVVLGAFLHLSIQIPFLFKVKIPKFKIGIKGYRNMIYCAKQTLPRGLTLATNQLNLFIDSILSGYLISGSLSLYNWTQNIFYLPLGMISISLSIPALTHFSEVYNDNDEEKLGQLLSNLIIILLTLSITISIWLYFQSENIINLLFNYGKFTAFSSTNIDTMKTALTYLILSLPFHSLIPIFVRFSHSKEKMYPPLIATIISVLVNLIVSYLLITKYNYGLSGLAIGFGFAGFIQATFFGIIYRNNFKNINVQILYPSLFLITICGLFIPYISRIEGFITSLLLSSIFLFIITYHYLKTVTKNVQ